MLGILLLLVFIVLYFMLVDRKPLTFKKTITFICDGYSLTNIKYYLNANNINYINCHGRYEWFDTPDESQYKCYVIYLDVYVDEYDKAIELLKSEFDITTLESK